MIPQIKPIMDLMIVLSNVCGITKSISMNKGNPLNTLKAPILTCSARIYNVQNTKHKI